MNSLLSKSFAVALGLASAFALTPAMAAPAFHLAPGAVPDANPRIIQIQNTPGSPQSGLDFYRDNRSGAYRNHNGYNRGRHYQQRYDYNRRGRHYRHRDRSYYRHRDNGAGVVGGLIAGAIIGGIASGALNNNGGNAHVNWCHNRYRSYRAYDNTFQPYNGPRRQCVSPY